LTAAKWEKNDGKAAERLAMSKLTSDRGLCLKLNRTKQCVAVHLQVV